MQKKSKEDISNVIRSNFSNFMIFNHFGYNFHVNDFLKVEVLKKRKKETMKFEEIKKKLVSTIIIKEVMKD